MNGKLKLLATLTVSVLVICFLNTIEAGTGDDDYNPMLIGGDFEGDILLTKLYSPSATGFMRSGVRNTLLRWPKNTVVYQLDPAFTASEITLINSAMNEIASKTCIRFAQVTTQTDYIYVVRRAARTGCSSFVGRIGGMQTLNLQAGVPGCISHGIIAHEYMHAIGFYHEQSRSDRDEYLKINWTNIPDENKRSFNKYNADLISNFGVPYDYQSVMHYGAYYFAINENIVLVICSLKSVEAGVSTQKGNMTEGDYALSDYPKGRDAGIHFFCPCSNQVCNIRYQYCACDRSCGSRCICFG